MTCPKIFAGTPLTLNLTFTLNGAFYSLTGATVVVNFINRLTGPQPQQVPATVQAAPNDNEAIALILGSINCAGNLTYQPVVTDGFGNVIPGPLTTIEIWRNLGQS